MVKWPGSTHDARMWRSSKAKKKIERQSVFAIAGDSAYPIARTLIKPYSATPTESHIEFNEAQARLRNDCTEKIFGQVKSRFLIMSTGLRTRLKRSQLLIVSCLVLHNMALVFNDPHFADLGNGDDGIDDLAPEEAPNPVPTAGQAETDVGRKAAGEELHSSQLIMIATNKYCVEL